MKLLLVTLLASSMAFAMLDRSTGDWGSGGGNAIVCFDKVNITNGETSVNIIDEIKKNKNLIPDKYLSHIESIEMYDLYEAKKRRGIGSKPAVIFEIQKEEKIYEYIDRVSLRFRSINTRVVELVQLGKALIPDTRLVFNNSALKYQDDLGSVSLPSMKCLVSTMAAQVNYGEFFEAHIDERLFNHPKHSRQSQATLILHELIYASARKLHKHTDSGSTRNLVRLIISSHKSITEKSVAENLYDLNLTVRGEDSYIVERMSTSFTMNQISMALINNVKLSIEDIMDDLQTDHMYMSLMKRAIILAQRDQIAINTGIDSLMDIRNLIEVGIIKGTLTQEWKILNEALWDMMRIISKEISGDIDGYLSLLLSVLNQDSSYRTLSTFDIRNIAGHAKFYFESLGVGYLNSSFESVLDIVESGALKKLESDLYTQMLSSVVCSDGTIFDSQKTKVVDSECYSKVLLDNIIPSF